MASGNWFRVSASAPVPMVTVNQFGVKLRTISRNGLASLRANGCNGMSRKLIGFSPARRRCSERQSIIPIDDFTHYDLTYRLNEAPVTLEQLRIFISVAERGHVTEGARALNLAQSAASHAIASLEARHDLLLFDRVGRRIALTEAGGARLVQARRILAEVEHAEQTLAEFGALERGALSLHASQTIAGYWLPQRLVAFQRAYPRIEIRLTIGNTAEVAAAVESGAAELGFVEGAVKSESL